MFESRIEIPTALVFGPIGWFNVIQLWGITMAGVRQLISSMSDRLEQGIARWKPPGFTKKWLWLTGPFSIYLTVLELHHVWSWRVAVELFVENKRMRVDAFSFPRHQDITKWRRKFGIHFPMRQPRFELLKNSLRAVVERRVPMAGIDGFMWMTWMTWECSTSNIFWVGQNIYANTLIFFMAMSWHKASR